MTLAEAMERLRNVGLPFREFSAASSHERKASGLRLRKVGNCFGNAALIALQNPAWRYVEGFAGVENMMVQHAWNCLPNGDAAFDTTWRTPDHLGLSMKYLGAEVPPQILAERILSATVHGPIFR